MRRHCKANHPTALCGLLLIAIIAATTTGCASLVESFASNLAEKDVKGLDQDFKVFEADLGPFRKCLKERGGSCQGSDTTALPHSSQHAVAQAVAPVSAGPSHALADSVAKLPAGHPARSALAVLDHSVVRQAAALHDHLRGHDAGAVPGFSVERGQGAHGGPESTATMSLSVGHVQHFHKRLLSSLGTTAWESLHGHCAALLASRENAPGRRALEADCRGVAFIRGYLEAYLRKGEFLEVDVKLAGAIHAVNKGAAKIKGEIEGLLADLHTIEKDISKAEARTLQEVSTAVGRVSSEVEALIKKVEGEITQRLGEADAAILSNLTHLADEAGSQSEALIHAADTALVKGVEKVVSDLDDVLGKVETELGKLEAKVSTLDHTVVRDITDALDKANATLSNVFRVSSVGFVSRDETFRAKLPALEVTLDQTAKQLVKVTDRDTGQVLTSGSDFADLGVATDTSGVGTGSSIGAEVVRVFLEAIFDAHEGLPAIASANPPNLKPTGLALGEYSLPLFTSPLGNIDSWDLTRMTNTNDQVAAKTRAITSRIIAGIGPFSLNNPSLEAFIVEIIATTVRQGTAKATWCWYACDLDVEAKKLEAGAKTAVKDKVKEVEAKVKAEAQELEDKAKAKEQELEGKLEALESKAKAKGQEAGHKGKALEGEMKAKEQETEGRLKELEGKVEAKAKEEAEHVKLRLRLTR